MSPRIGLPRLLREDPRALAFAFTVAWGVLQSLMQAANNGVGAHAPAYMIWLYAIPIGAAWGAFQLHLIAGALWVVARSPSGRLPFRRIRYLVALSAAPTAYAFVAWGVATILLGRAVFIDPALLASEVSSPRALLQLMVLYFGTVVCITWSYVLLVAGVRNVTGSSILGAIWVTVQSLFVIMVAAFAIVLVAVAVAVAIGS